MSTISNTKSVKIKSPEGFVDFIGIQKISRKEYCHIIFDDNSELKTSLNHRFLQTNGILILSKNVLPGTIIKGEYKDKIVLSNTIIPENIELYDILDAGKEHLFYTNDIVSHNCLFLGSQNTLISAQKLNLLSHDKPLTETENSFIYEYPKPNHSYVVVVDCAQGQGLDFSTFTILDVTKIPYKQIACYRDKNVSPASFPTYIYNAAKRYNDAYILVENNDVGSQVVHILHQELEYENIFCSKQSVGRAGSGQTLTPGPIGNAKLGVRTTMSIKKIGCANLKSLIENNKLLIKDFNTISELTTFVADKQSFAADDGKFDDLVMNLVLFGWLQNQDIFKDLTNTNFRKSQTEEDQLKIQEEMLPFGIISQGELPNEPFVDQKREALWEYADTDFWGNDEDQ